MHNLELINLMEQINKSRDEMAFSKIFDFLAPKVNSYYIQNGLYKEIAEELTQEVMSTIWAKSYQYNSAKSSPSTWIYTIARNKKVDFLRKNSKIKVNEDDIREFLYDDSRSDNVKEEKIIEQVSKINAGLNKEQKKIIKMNFYENKSHKKIAEELEIPLGTVKSRIRHILKKLHNYLL